MLHGALHLTTHARALVRAISTSGALAAPGVIAVYTAADVPGERRVGIIYQDWPIFIGVGERTSYAGDVLAIVVAATRQQAREAAALDRGRLRGVSADDRCRSALADDAEVAVWGTSSNVLSVSEYQRGSVDEALAASAFTVSETFQTQRIEHAFLEPESTLAVPQPAGRLARLLGRSGSVGRPQSDRRDPRCRA